MQYTDIIKYDSAMERSKPAIDAKTWLNFKNNRLSEEDTKDYALYGSFYDSQKQQNYNDRKQISEAGCGGRGLITKGKGNFLGDKNILYQIVLGILLYKIIKISSKCMIKMGEIYHYKLYHDKTGKYLRMLENNIQVKPFPTKVQRK